MVLQSSPSMHSSTSTTVRSSLCRVPPAGGQNRTYIQLSKLAANPTTIRKHFDEKKNMGITLQYTAVGYPLKDEPVENIELIARAENSNQLFEVSLVLCLISFYWQQCKPMLWGLFLFHLIPTVFLSLYAYNYTSEGAWMLLLPLLVSLAIYVTFEGIEAAARIGNYLKDPWNWVDITVIASHIGVCATVWSGADDGLQRMLVSAAIVFAFTKMLMLMRVIDQLRYLVRMMLEILNDSLSFFVVATVYILAFSLVLWRGLAVWRGTAGGVCAVLRRLGYEQLHGYHTAVLRASHDNSIADHAEHDHRDHGRHF